MTRDGDERDPLEAGLKAGYSTESRDPGESVLAAIERLHGSDSRSQVALRDIEEGGTPVALMRDHDHPAVDDSRYQVLGEIARGGVGVIYRGRDKDLNREVALKVLKTDHAENPDVVQRFIEEAQVGGQLQHPGIVPIYGMGLQADGRTYFAMKLIKGRTLSAMLESNPSGINLLSVFESIAQTMAYAHSRGVIHRDLKPANIMIGAFGEVLVVDWGFAKVLGLDDAAPAAPKTTVIATVRSEAEGSQSIAGSVMGTPAYMPPEQALGHVDELDERSDVFALGAILCEVLTGEAPYTGSMRDQLLAASQCRLDEAHERLDKCDVADELKQLARDCMQPLGKKRPADAGVVAERVSRHFAAVEERVRSAELKTIEAEAAAERSRRARKQTLALAALALVAMLGSGGGYFWWRSESEASRNAAAQRVATALGKAATLERAGDRIAAISAAKKAIDIAETEQTDAREARATVTRLEREQKEAKNKAFIEFRNKQLHDALEAVFFSPNDEIRYTVAPDCQRIFESQFGTGEGSWKRAAQRLMGSPLAPALAFLLYQWSEFLPAGKRGPMLGLADTIDATQAKLRKAIAAEDSAAILKELETLGLESVSPRAIVTSLGPLEPAVRARILRRGARIYPHSFLMLEFRGYYAITRLRVEDGMRHYTAAVALRPRLKSLRHGFATVLEWAHRYDDAIRVWHDAVTVHPRWAHGYQHLALAYVKNGQREAGERWARRAVGFDPTTPAYLLYLHHIGDNDAALVEARRALDASIAARPALPSGKLASSYLWVARFLYIKRAYKESIPYFLRVRELSPDNALKSWDELCAAYTRVGEHEKAADALRDALRSAPAGRKAIWLQTAGRAWGLSYGQRAALGQRVLERQPDDAFGWSYLGLALRRLGRWEEAVRAYEESVQREPRNAQLWRYYASADQARGQFDKAEEKFQKALEISGRAAWDLIMFARMRVAQGRHEEAEALRKEVIDRFPGWFDGWIDYVQSLQQRKDHKAALAATRRLYRLRPSLLTLAQLAGALRNAGDAQGALKELQVVLEHPKHPQAARAWRELGYARIAAGVPGAAEAFEKAVELARGGVDGNGRDCWFNLGRELSKQHAPAVVRKKLRELVDRTARPEIAWWALLDTYLDMGDYASTLALADDTGSLRFPEARAHHARGRAYSAMGRYSEALEELDKVDPSFKATLGDGWLEFRKAEALFGLGRFAEGVAILDRAGRQNAHAWYRRVAKLVPRIPAILAGEDKPEDKVDAQAFVHVLHAKGHYKEAVALAKRFDFEAGHWAGLCSAIQIDDPVALKWMRAAMRYCAGELKTNPGSVRAQLQTYYALHPVVGKTKGKEGWEEVWAEHARLLAEAKKLTW